LEETLKAERSKLRLVSEGIIKIFFGAWNGIQVFVYPTLILYMLDSVSLVYWFSNLLTIKQYHLPLSLFLLILFYDPLCGDNDLCIVVIPELLLSNPSTSKEDLRSFIPVHISYTDDVLLYPERMDKTL
jgi:hypothetical protein